MAPSKSSKSAGTHSSQQGDVSLLHTFGRHLEQPSGCVLSQSKWSSFAKVIVSVVRDLVGNNAVITLTTTVVPKVDSRRLTTTIKSTCTCIHHVV